MSNARSFRRDLLIGQTEPTERGRVPERLRRFVLEEWIEPSRLPAEVTDRVQLEHDWTARAAGAHVAFDKARAVWMVANGYDPKSKYGKNPDHDYWAFLKRCHDEEESH